MLKNTKTPKETAISELASGDLFLTMRHTSGDPFSGEKNK